MLHENGVYLGRFEAEESSVHPDWLWRTSRVTHNQHGGVVVENPTNSTGSVGFVNPLMQPVEWQGKEYRTSHYLHQYYLANSEHAGKYVRHANFLRVLTRLEAYQDYIEKGDIVVLPTLRWVRNALQLVNSEYEFTNDFKILRDVFAANDHKRIYLVNATIQVALSHHLDDQENKQLSVATNTAAARQLAGKGTLALELAKRTLQAALDIGELIGTPKHIVLEFGVKRAQLDTGVDLSPLLLGTPVMAMVAADEMMLEPTDLAVRLLGLPQTNASGKKMNAFLQQMGWQRRSGTGSPWIPTDAGSKYAVAHPWFNHGKTGYNYKWNIEAVRTELQRRGMLPAQGA